MAIRSILINVADVTKSVEFYTRFLNLEPVEVTADGAVLDAVTATVRLRHVGFKVSDLDRRVAELHEADVPFHLEPIHAEGDVRLTFFYDPDGTLVELVEGPLRYHEVYDRDAVDRDWGLGTPTRPRFDHVGETVADVRSTQDYFEELGYRLMAGIHQPNDERGFEINFLRDGDSSLEIFTFDRAEKLSREPQITAPGFAAVEFEGTVPGQAVAVGSAFGTELYADPDGLVHAITQP